MSEAFDRLVTVLRRRPDASVPVVLGAADADPAVWGDVVRDALAAEDPADALEAPGGVGEGGTPDTNPTPKANEAPSDSGAAAEDEAPYASAAFATPTAGVWPDELLAREQWMGRAGKSGKQPFAPWAGRDHPEADTDEDARWKWGLAENYVDGATVAVAEDDHRLAGRVFLQQADDPYAFVDGDDVRDPETGEVHPEFVALLEQLGATYADVSTSGTGVHANYRGELPDGVKQATFAIDTEPWGANDELPEAEIYAGKHVCVLTGEHVPGTPTEVNDWDDEALRAILDEHDQLPTRREDVASEFESFDLAEYEASATTSDETTDDIRDVFAALERLDARRVADETIVHQWNDDASTSDGHRAFVPSWGRSANGTANVVNDRIWQDTGGGGYGGPVAMASIALGDTSPDHAGRGAPAGADWFRAVGHLRDLGYAIPEYEASDDTEHTAVLPPAVRDLTDGIGQWDWEDAATTTDDSLSVADARDRTTAAIADAYRSRDRVLVEALPTMGKSYGAVKAAAETGEPVTILTGRGHKEQYEQFRQWAEEFGLEARELPRFTDDCPTAAGEHGEEWRDRVMGWYNRGATGQQIHNQAEYELGRPLPCQTAETGEEVDCPHRHAWEFDAEEYDVLIGHYTHAYTEAATEGRTVVVDEFPDAYETTLTGDTLEGAVTCWLQQTPDVPYATYTDLVENRTDQQRRSDALLYFEDHGTDADEGHVFDDASAHADAPLAVFTLLAGEDLGNGWKRAPADDGATGLFADGRDDWDSRSRVHLHRPPALQYANGIVALDGTPTKRMWELALGTRLNHRPVLQDAERAEYIREALNLNLVRTTEHIKPYNNDEHVNTDQDAALLEEIAEAHGERPAVISTTTALEEYDVAGVTEYTDGTKHYGNILGSNEFASTRLGAVIGSQHYGDGYIKKWGAYADEAVERNDEKGAGLSYGAFGDDVLAHMREHETLQAAMRFGRDANGAVVYVHTDTLPEWVPLAGEARVLKTWSDGMRDILAALEDLETATTAAVVDHPAVDVGRRQVFDHLETLRDRGVLRREQDAADGRRVVWRDDGLHRLGEHGDVDLQPVELEGLADEEVQELARSTQYTWEFTNLATEDGGSAADSALATVAPARGTVTEGDPPPSAPE